jgi:hypothetical protein
MLRTYTQRLGFTSLRPGLWQHSYILAHAICRNGSVFNQANQITSGSLICRDYSNYDSERIRNTNSNDFCKVKFTFLLLSSLFFMIGTVTAQQTYQNKKFKDGIQSIQVYPEGNPLGYPFIGLNSGENLEFHFDMMSTDLSVLSFGVIHCSHDWKKSDLESSEYLTGFQTQNISTFEAAFNTMYEYAHYEFLFPNDMSKPKYSGNYAMIVFEGNDLNDTNSWLVTYRFMIYESAVSVLSKVGPSSVIADRYTSQEVDFDIAYKDFTMYDPMREINVSILQNMQWDNAKHGLKPIFQKPDVLTFDYNLGENAFGGGSEWRNFDAKNTRYVSAEVEAIMLESDGFNYYLRTDLPEGKRAYASWADLNGNFLVKNDQADNSNLEAEYILVHFRLKIPETPESEVLIEGKFNQFDSTPIKCTYDKTEGVYKAKVLLKQGYYNYRYGIHDTYFSVNDHRSTEGNYAATENDYHIIVYKYDRNLECDRIIAVKADKSFR